jgi:hypothetical protein
MRLILLVVVLFSFQANAQTAQGARSLGLANSTVASQGIWSLNDNQAGLATIKRLSLALDYQKLLIGQPVALNGLLLALPVKNHVFGLTYSTYGFEAYRAKKMGLAYARNFGSKLCTALTFYYNTLAITHYGKSGIYSIDAGFQYQLNPSVRIASHIGNLSNSTFQNDKLFANFPVKIQFGAFYQTSEQVSLSMMIEETLARNAQLNLGLEYHIAPTFELRGGVSSSPFRQYAGLGLAKADFKLDLAVASQQVLGYISQISLAYDF